MSAASRSRDFTDTVSSYRLMPRECPAGEKCRCGTRFAAVRTCVGFEQVPKSLEGLVAGRAFCGPVCARAFIREALELSESPAAPSVLSDLDEVQKSLRLLLSLMEIEQFARPSHLADSTRSRPAGRV